MKRLKGSPVLQVCLVVSFLCYGGMTALLVTGRLGNKPTAYGPGFVLAAVVTILSLASWFLLLLWYPTLEATKARTSDRAWIGTALEFFAVGCVALVTALMAIIVVYVARS